VNESELRARVRYASFTLSVPEGILWDRAEALVATTPASLEQAVSVVIREELESQIRELHLRAFAPLFEMLGRFKLGDEDENDLRHLP
jgi:hypothetical protein